MAKKQKTGYSKKNKYAEGLKQEGKYLSGLITPFGKKMPIGERVVKFFIYIALRLVIRPKKWRHPKKNFEIIDRAYKRIMSSDFIYIPSSIAMYFIMAFLPIVSIIMLMSFIPFPTAIVGHHMKDDVTKVLQDFIPGAGKVIDSMSNITSFSGKVGLGLISTIIISAWIASTGFSKLIFTQSHIYNFKYTGGFWMNRLKGMAIVILLSIFLGFALIVNILFIRLIDNTHWSKSSKNIVTRVYLYIGLVALIFFGFVILFKFSPRYRIKIRYVIPGAAVAAIPTSLFLALFGYITSLWSYGAYGPVAIIMYIAASSLILSYFLFVGLIVNVSYYNTFVKEPLVKKITVSRK